MVCKLIATEYTAEFAWRHDDAIPLPLALIGRIVRYKAKQGLVIAVHQKRNRSEPS